MDPDKLKIENVEIKNVEILSVGTWNGVAVKAEHLDEMIKNFNDGVLEPYLNLDHDDKYTDKVKKALSVVSLGFVSHLQKVGDKLIADFKQVPKKVAELIDSGMLKKRSVEFFRKGLKVNGKAFNNVLKAVSFFGADIPAVNNLSNDFDVLLKSKINAICLSANTDSADTIILKNKGEIIMDKIEVSKQEYNDLVSFKAANETTITRLQAENEALQTANDDMGKKVADLEKDNKELKTFKANAIEEKKANLEKEADDYINGVIKDGKLLPKFKADKVADYIEKSADADKLAIFKEDLESRDKVIDLTSTEGDNTNGSGKIDFEAMTNDEIMEVVENRMKAKGEDFDAACKALGVDLPNAN